MVVQINTCEWCGMETGPGYASDPRQSGSLGVHGLVLHPDCATIVGAMPANMAVRFLVERQAERGALQIQADQTALLDLATKVAGRCIESMLNGHEYLDVLSNDFGIQNPAHADAVELVLRAMAARMIAGAKPDGYLLPEVFMMGKVAQQTNEHRQTVQVGIDYAHPGCYGLAVYMGNVAPHYQRNEIPPDQLEAAIRVWDCQLFGWLAV